MASEIELARQQVLDYYNLGWSYRSIATQVARSAHLVGYAINRWEKSKALSDPPRSGRPKKSLMDVIQVDTPT